MKNDSVYLTHILDSIDQIESHVGTATQAEFLSNGMTQDAVVRRLEIIGEAARNLSDQARESHPGVEWGSIIGLRNRLIHAYFQVDIDVVWEIVSTDLPSLKAVIREMIGVNADRKDGEA